jgi:molecular chaperone DnaJ
MVQALNPAPARAAATCAVGMVKSAPSRASFMVERTCPTCHGRGEVIEKPCRSCRGEGRVDTPQKLDVTIPPGVDTGTRIRLASKGEAGPFGSPPGDLYIFIHIRRHAVFERDGTTLVTRVPIYVHHGRTGRRNRNPGLDGKHIKIEIPAGIQSGKQLRKRGEGMPVLQGRGRGDLVIEIMVETPTKLSAARKELLRELQETETGDETPQSKGFFDRIKDAFGA